MYPRESKNPANFEQFEYNFKQFELKKKALYLRLTVAFTMVIGLLHSYIAYLNHSYILSGVILLFVMALIVPLLGSIYATNEKVLGFHSLLYCLLTYIKVSIPGIFVVHQAPIIMGFFIVVPIAGLFMARENAYRDGLLLAIAFFILIPAVNILGGFYQVEFITMENIQYLNVVDIISLFFILNFLIFHFNEFNGLLNKNLMEQSKELLISKKVQDDFIASASHELRTPLNVIKGNSHLLHRSLGEREELDQIRQASDHLLFLVGDMLDVSKIDRGVFAPIERVFELKKVLHRVAHIYQNNNFHVDLFLDPELPKYVRCDEMRVAQVLNTLFSMVTKLSEARSAIMEVNVVQLKDSSAIQFSIQVDAQHISSSNRHYIKRIEENFKLNTRKNSDQFLGIYIAKSIAQSLGGDLILEYDDYKGLDADLFIPIKIVADTQKAKPQMNQNQAITVLLVEDNLLNTIITEKLLNDDFENIEILTATNGIECVKMFQENKEKVDLILMDLMMPLMDGYEATEKIREILAGRELPIIACSANVSEDIRLNYHKYGFDGYLSKPIEPMMLREAIQNLALV